MGKEGENMEWTQFLTLIVSMGGVFFWSRSESRSDMRHFEAKMEAQISAIREEGKIFREKWAEESKEFNARWAEESRDFHGRLCAIEERRNQILMERK